VGCCNGNIYLRYHEAADPADINRLLVLRSNASAGWLDDYEEMQRS
jgi:hypothetical protein